MAENLDFPRETNRARGRVKKFTPQAVEIAPSIVSQREIALLTDLVNRRDELDSIIERQARHIFRQLLRGRIVEPGSLCASICRLRGKASICWSLTVNGRPVRIDG